MNFKDKNKIVINIIGGSLLGCITALKLKDRGFKRINIIDNKKILNGLNPIIIKKKKFNNGFHGIEIPRANNLIKYLELKLNYKFIIDENNRHLLINNHLIKCNINHNRWPKKLQKYFPNKKIKSSSRFFLFKKTDKKIQELLKKAGKRYSKNIKECLHQFIPWFLPNNFILENTKDEGDIFRKKVISKNIKTYYAFPKSRIFFELKNLITKLLKKEKIIIKNNYKINFNKLEKKNYINIFCASSTSFLPRELLTKMMKNYAFLKIIIFKLSKKASNKFKNITEILCANEKLFEISRISFPKENNKVEYMQLETYVKKMNTSKDYLNTIQKELQASLSLKRNDLKIFGTKITRKVFFPSQKLNNNYVMFINKKNKTRFNKNFIFKTYLGPINMTKAWIWSDEIVQKISKYASR